MEEPVTTVFEELEPPDLPQDAVYTSCYCEENVYLLCQRFLSLPNITENWHIWTVFISNVDKKVALFSQKAARGDGLPVVWDYHVILLLQPKELLGCPPRDHPTIRQSDVPRIGARPWVYDFDTRLPVPCLWENYLTHTFPSDLLPEYTSSFRVISAQIYLSNFASDRSHMLVDVHPRDSDHNSGDCDRRKSEVNEKAALDKGREINEESRKLVYSAPTPPYEPLFGTAMREGRVKTNLMSHFVCMESLPWTFGELVTRSEISSRFLN
ncbi:hypothetical protein FA13DRAFT_1237263 [Coprinellus micaceus]|uniref:Protein N-terminal glutamine amidohydrolase n=1 Tax=Coprinellus micaceus TaxID=71717 RepID=A0A4Y7TQK7_COPMI|nr:hypothetical protein FA13DRAFT_1237263 [Coprinellus micaceus]